MAEGVAEFVKGVCYSNSVRQRQHQLTRIVHTEQGQRHLCRSSCYSGWASSCDGDYLEINLGYPRYVTHIGTAGTETYYQVCYVQRNITTLLHYLQVSTLNYRATIPIHRALRTSTASAGTTGTPRRSPPCSLRKVRNPLIVRTVPSQYVRYCWHTHSNYCLLSHRQWNQPEEVL